MLDNIYICKNKCLHRHGFKATTSDVAIEYMYIHHHASYYIYQVYKNFTPNGNRIHDL